MRQGRRRVLAGLVVGLAIAGHAATAGAAGPSRYSLANGCYALRDSTGAVVPGGERLRMQATALGSYLLYRPDKTFLSSQADGSLAPATEPSSAGDWKVTDSGGKFTLAPASGGKPLPNVSFSPADGCAVYPEAELDATGTPRKSLPFGRVGGLVEGHMHWMTFEYLGGNFHCGRPWHPYGITSALPDCASIEGPQGSAAPVQNFLNFGSPESPHDTTGFPKMTAWGPGNLTYEGTYWRWIQRAWLGGLRLMVMSVNENRVLCQLQANRKTNCDEMDTVRRGFQDIRELQDYVDAQAGGPGKGFFQIVTDPLQARRVINQGKMAVVLEIEVSEFLGCKNLDAPTCNQAQVDRELDDMYRLGVRSSLLLNKVDNPLTGVRFDSGAIGVLINAANKESAGSFWSAKTCTGKLADNTIETVEPSSNAFLSTALGALGVQQGTVPSYPPAPHCNTRGLSPLGKHVVERMMDKHMIVNPDHMSQAGVADTLSLLEARKYSGVISPHGWMDPGNWPRLWKLGGVAFPGHSAAADYVKDWRKYRPKRTPYFFGWGYGADLGGLSHQPDPDGAGKITYPFKSYDGSVTFQRQKTGDRTFDYNQDGVAHYGLYADWFDDLRRLGGKQMANDLYNGSEAYLEMWERADGIPTRDCAISHGAFSSTGLARIRIGAGWEALLRRAGQPQQRSQAWSWCVKGNHNLHAADVAVLSDAGKVELVGSTARGHSAGGIAVNQKPPRGLRSGITIRRVGKATRFYVVRKGRVRAVGVTTRSLSRRTKALRTAIARVLSAQATQGPPSFVPSAFQASLRGKPTGQPLAGTSDPVLNAKFAMLCSLQVQ